MRSDFRTPSELVEALHLRHGDARARLWHILHDSVDKLMSAIIQRHSLADDRKFLTAHAMHAAETWLRSQPQGAMARFSWEAFRATILALLARMATQPHGTSQSDGLSFPPFPESEVYRSEAFSRPYTRLGSRFFGGDWYTARQLDDGSLWVFLADVTGHGYFAYLLATALPAVWQRCWAAHPDTPPEPAELLAAMHDLLSDSLPEGIFLEATLACLGPDGRTTVVPAGGTRLIHRRGEGKPGGIQLRGAWLGLCPPSREQQHVLHLGDGDELILATDGAYDQLHEQGGLDAVPRAWRSGSVFVLMRELLEASLSSGDQKDDITVVWLKRLDTTKKIVLRFPGADHV